MIKSTDDTGREAAPTIEERLARIESAVDRLSEAMEQIPNVVSTLADTFDATAARIQAADIDIDQRLAGSVDLLERLTEPSTVAAINGMLEMLHQAPGFASMLADTVDGLAGQIFEAGIDIDERLASTMELGEMMTARATVDGLGQVLDARAVGIIGMIGTSLVRCQEECMTLPEPRQYGPIKAMMALRDADTQRGLAFLINVGRFFGAQMGERHAEMKAERISQQDHS